MKIEVVIEAALVAVLAVYGVHFATEARTLNSEADELRGILANGSTQIRSIMGIDVSGQMVNKIIPPGTKRFVVFSLRGTTLEQDLNFWGGLAALLPKESGIRFVGFCDTTACAQRVGHLYESLSFPVIAYGDAGASQAVLNADAQGDLILLSGALETISKVRWRGEDVTPASVTRLVLP